MSCPNYNFKLVDTQKLGFQVKRTVFMQNKIRLTPSGTEFLCQQGQTVLEAALSNSINLEYGCSNGRCGQCKAKLLDGLVANSSNTPDVEIPDDFILTCCSIPQTDLLLKARYLPELNDIKCKTIPAKVDSLAFKSANILVMTLRIPPSATFEFIPGQHIDLLWDGSKRSYSIANSSVRESKIDLHIKKVDAGLFSNFMFNKVKPNDVFRLFGPLGTFFLRVGTEPLFFLCTGTGFAPVKAMVESLIEVRSLRKIHIFWGGRILADIYSDLPFKWAEEFSNIQFTPVLSRETNLPDNIKLGYVQSALIEQYNELHEAEVYACGSAQMIDDAQKLLVESGLKTDHFYADAFVSSNQPNQE